jgi:hypothetical protein
LQSARFVGKVTRRPGPRALSRFEVYPENAMSLPARRFRPQLQRCEERCVPAFVFTTAFAINVNVSTLTIFGRAGAQNIAITDTGHNGLSTVNVQIDGRSFTYHNLTGITVVTRPANDNVSYTLQGTLSPIRSVNVFLGPGTSSFNANLVGTTNHRVVVAAHGGAGHNTLTSFTGSGTISDVELFGGSGSGDTISETYQGSSGDVGLIAVGSARGHDNIAINFQDAGQTQQLVSVTGRGGNNTVTYTFNRNGSNATSRGPDLVLLNGGDGDNTVNLNATGFFYLLVNFTNVPPK